MKKYPGLCTYLLVGSLVPLAAQTPPALAERTYHVEQTVTLSDLPAGAKTVKWWLAIPGDDPYQTVLDVSGTIPGTWGFVSEAHHGNRFLYTEIPAPGTSTVTAKLEFTVRRRSVWIDIEPAKTGPMTDTLRRLWAEELRRDAPHMQVTPTITAMADRICGSESNLAAEAKLLLNAVADGTVHYSRDPSKPKYSPGDAESCLANGGGTCTDIHSLFIALARSRGIPARLEMGYRLREANESKNVDPGYRCWVEYFLPGYGWVPTDLVEAEDPKGLGRERWFTGLTERRLRLNEGREFDLPGRDVTDHRVNTMVIGYAEVDGVEARVLPAGGKPAQLARTVLYTEVKAPAGAVVAR